MTAIMDAKKAVVQDIKDKFSRANSVVLLDYKGLTVEQVTDLRNQFRKADVEYHVLKNTMVNLAAQELQIDGLEEYLKGPTAIAFSYDDPTAGPKIIAEYIKKNKRTEIKCGVIGTQTLKAPAVEALSELPSKEVLVAQLLGVMNGPARGLVTVLSGPARGLVTALSAIKDQMSA